MKLKRVKKKIKLIFFKYSVKIVSFFISFFVKIDENKILFLSDTRSELGGNLEYIYNGISDKKYTKLIFFKTDRRSRRGLKNTISLIYQLQKSKYIILDDLNKMIEYSVFKGEQEIIQLWHGCGAYKRFGFASSEKILAKTKIHSGYRKYTKAIVSSNKVKRCFSDAFDISINKVYSTGIPRTDIFFNNEYKDELRKKYLEDYPEFKNKKIILFAPTYRGIAYKNEYYDFDKLDIDNLYQKLSKTHVFLIKNHPCMINNSKAKIFLNDVSKYSTFFYDFTSIRDLNDLLIISDIFITDYSSSIFEYALLNKPIVYFTPDLEDYIKDKGLFFNFEKYIYGAVTKNDEQLVTAILKENLFPKKQKEFINTFMSSCNGHSTKNVINLILENN